MPLFYNVYIVMAICALATGWGKASDHPEEKVCYGSDMAPDIRGRSFSGARFLRIYKKDNRVVI